MTHAIFRFGSFTVDPDRGLLKKGEKRIALGRRAFEILLVLLEHAGQVVSHGELLTRVWPETVVEDNNLRVQLSAIRRALNDGEDPVHYILNVPGRGYSFVAEIERLQANPDLAAHSPVLFSSLTRLVGRGTIVKDIIGHLAHHRFSTIVGSGGLGKTSVALAIAHEMQSRFAHGCSFVDLASLTDPELVAATVADALRIPLLSETYLSALVNHLSGRHVLIVLDNCEHVIDQAALLVETVLKGAPHVHFLATSREPLNAEGEWLWRLPALDVPPSEDPPKTALEVLQYPAAELFVERAAAVLDTLRVTDDDARLLIRLCRKLEGIPLAIELAAARVDVFGLEGLVAELDDSLAFLTRGRRTAQPRQRTLRATLDWSFALLRESEKTMLARLGVFTTGFSREAAIAVSCDDSLTAEQAVESLTQLVAKSLIVVRFSNGQVHFRLLDPTRAYAVEKLGAGPAAHATHHRHAKYFYEVAARLEPEKAASEVRRPTDDRILIAEVRAALRWCFDEGDTTLGLMLIAASSLLWYGLSLVDEYISFARRALSRASAEGELQHSTREAEMQALLTMGQALFYTQGSAAELVACYGKALEIANEAGDVDAQKRALRGFWQYRHGLGQHDEALRYADAYAQRSGDSMDMTLPRMRAITYTYSGDLAQAQACVERCLSHSIGPAPSVDLSTRDVDQRVVNHAVLARTLWLRGLPSRALESAQESMSIAIAGQHALSICFGAALAGCPVALWSGELAMAARNVYLLEERSASFSLTFWHHFSEVYRRGLETRTRDPHDAPAGKHWRDPQWGYRHLEELSVLGEGFATDALIERAQSGDPIWCSAEVLRLEALRLLREQGEAGSPGAIDLLSRSLDIARRQGALSWELRSATSLARLLRQQHRIAEARVLLSDILERFPDPAETPDYLLATDLMKKIAS